MKTLKYIIPIVAVLFATSCKKGFFEDVNKSDNLPSDVSMAALLPSAQGNLSFAQGGDVSRYTGVFNQYITGGFRQFAAYDIYSFTENDFDNLWRLNLYGGPMQDLRIIQEKAKAGGNITYQAIANVLMAYSLGMVTDLFGDCPYSGAFMGDQNLQPAFDSQQQVYSTIQGLLDEAITLLGQTDNSTKKPGADDLMYGGSKSSWTKLAYGLKARFYIHLTKRDASANAANALTALANGLTGGDDAQLIYGTSEVNANPWYQYIRDRDDILYEGYCLTEMQNKNDPRYGVYIDTADVYWGTGYLGPFFAAAEASDRFFTYYEQKFIEAEAKLITGDDAGAQAALGEAITANMSYLGVASADDAAYQAANVSWTGTNTDKMKLIIYEKYVAMFLNYEGWTDYRRTGYPELTPNPSGVISQIPRRFIYPSSERLYNTNCPSNSTLISPRLWWDQ